MPLATVPTAATFLIALPWGRETDWVRNVRAAGSGRVRWRGRDYECSEPEFVDKAVMVAAARPVLRLVLRRLPLPEGALRLVRTPA